MPLRWNLRGWCSAQGRRLHRGGPNNDLQSIIKTLVFLRAGPKRRRCRPRLCFLNYIVPLTGQETFFPSAWKKCTTIGRSGKLCQSVCVKFKQMILQQGHRSCFVFFNVCVLCVGDDKDEKPKNKGSHNSILCQRSQSVS